MADTHYGNRDNFKNTRATLLSSVGLEIPHIRSYQTSANTPFPNEVKLSVGVEIRVEI